MVEFQQEHIAGRIIAIQNLLNCTSTRDDYCVMYAIYVKQLEVKV
jgi:hypothetical protein